MARFEPHGRKEIAEAVLVAALVAVTEGLIAWGLEALRERAERRAKAARKAKRQHDTRR